MCWSLKTIGDEIAGIFVPVENDDVWCDDDRPLARHFVQLRVHTDWVAAYIYFYFPDQDHPSKYCCPARIDLQFGEVYRPAFNTFWRENFLNS